MASNSLPRLASLPLAECSELRPCAAAESAGRMAPASSLSPPRVRQATAPPVTTTNTATTPTTTGIHRRRPDGGRETGEGGPNGGAAGVPAGRGGNGGADAGGVNVWPDGPDAGGPVTGGAG